MFIDTDGPVRPRVTHVVLVGGLPVDSWVVTGEEARPYVDLTPSWPGRRTRAHRSEDVDAYPATDAPPPATPWIVKSRLSTGQPDAR
ncbi:MAG: hypothetical protein ABI083_17765 [Lapillicoccus sp.]